MDANASSIYEVKPKKMRAEKKTGDQLEDERRTSLWFCTLDNGVLFPPPLRKTAFIVVVLFAKQHTLS